MHVSRAGFLRVCGLAALGGALPAWPASDTGVSSAASSSPLTSSSGSSGSSGFSEASHFRPHVGDTFDVGSTPYALRLINVSEGPVQNGLEQFSLVFSGAGELGDGIYTLGHPALGRQDLFLARIGPHAAGHCEACFSRHAGGTRA